MFDTLDFRMNWTGGRLQRSKHAAKGLSAKQKQYFAATRARLQGGGRAHSPPWVILFEGTDREIRLPRRGNPTNANDQEHRGSQERVVKSHSVAARGDRKRRPPSEIAEESTSKRQSRRPENPSVESNHTKAEAYEHNIKPKRQYQRLPETEDELQTARLEILEMMKKDDWLGPKVSKPLKMTFPSFEEKQKVGRRRKLTKADIERRNQATYQRFSPVKEDRSGLSRLPRRREHVLDHDEVSIRVGSVIHGSQITDRRVTLALTNSNLLAPDDTLDGSTYSPKEHYLPPRLDAQPVLSDEIPMDPTHFSEGRFVNPMHSDQMLRNSIYSTGGKSVKPMYSDNPLGESMHSDEMLIESLCSDEMLLNSIPSSGAPRSAKQIYETRSPILNTGERDGPNQDLLAETGGEVVAQSENPGKTGLAYEGVKADSEGCETEITDHLHPTPNVINAKDETQEVKNEKPDEEAVWFKWVFGYDKTKDEEDEVPELSTHTPLVETAADTPNDQKDDDLSSVIAEASQTPPEAKTPHVLKNGSMANHVGTSPDPLSIDHISSRRDLPSSKPDPVRLHPRVVFKKPTLFRGLRPPTATVHIGKNIGSSPVRDHNRPGWRKSRSTRRSRSQMTWVQCSSDGEEEIED